MLTNFETIRGRVNKLKEMEEFINNGYVDNYLQKEVAQLNRQLQIGSKLLGGIKRYERFT